MISYDLWNAIDNIWGGGEKKSGETGLALVIRPDSGDPIKWYVKPPVAPCSKIWHYHQLKGYPSLPSYVRLIQGMVLIPPAWVRFIDAVIKAGFSSDNNTFGMGGGYCNKSTAIP